MEGNIIHVIILYRHSIILTRSCCVDEVAAEHVSADLVVHFGQACMTPTTRLPVYYYHHNRRTNQQLAEHIKGAISQFPQSSDGKLSIVIADQEYNNVLSSVQQDMESTCTIAPVLCNFHNPLMTDCNTNRTDSNTIMFCGRRLPVDDIDKVGAILYIGSSETLLSTVLLTFHHSRVFSFNPTECLAEIKEQGSETNRFISRRLALINRVRMMDRIGVLVGTLAVANYREIIDKLYNLITSAGKCPEVVVVGKLNPAKLGNFMEIEAFVNVACPLNTLIPSEKSFMQPIITPYELQLALGVADDMVAESLYGRYVLDFERLTVGDAIVDDDADDAVTEMSGNVGALQISSSSAGGQKLVHLNHKRTLVAGQRSDNQAVQRTWWGLDTSEAQRPIEKAATGRSGVARSYISDLTYEE